MKNLESVLAKLVAWKQGARTLDRGTSTGSHHEWKFRFVTVNVYEKRYRIALEVCAGANVDADHEVAATVRLDIFCDGVAFGAGRVAIGIFAQSSLLSLHCDDDAGQRLGDGHLSAVAETFCCVKQRRLESAG